jgi:hypothetical protein
MEQRQPINASMARRIGSGSVGQASMTLTKFGSVVSNPVSTESLHTGFPDRFSETEQVSNLPALVPIAIPAIVPRPGSPPKILKEGRTAGSQETKYAMRTKEEDDRKPTADKSAPPKNR